MKIGTKNWEEFRVGDLFDSLKISGINNDSLNKDFSNGAYRYITRTSSNFGISDITGKIDDVDFQRANVFSLGLLNMDFFFQSEPWYAGQFVRAIVPKFAINNNLAIYFQTIFNRRKDIYTQVLVRDFDKTFLNDVIKLPAIDPDKPDFDYMEKYIEEMKFEYIDKLEKDNDLNIDKALEVTGLSYEDLDKELIVEPADRYEEFRVGDLFDIQPTKSYNLLNNELYDVNGMNPVIANSGLNNGITGFTNKSCTEKGNIITFSDTTDHNAIFYQPYDFVGYSHIQGLYPIKHEDKWNRATLLYFMTVFKKIAASCNFSYGNKFTRYIAMDFKITLPAIDKDTPDFDYMEKAIYIYSAKKIKLEKLSNEKEIEVLRRII